MRPVDPFALCRLAIWSAHDAAAVLHSPLPIAFVAFLVGPCVPASAMLLIIVVLTNIVASVWPPVLASPLHFVLDPVALVDSSIRPLKDPRTPNHIFAHFSLVRRAVIPHEVAPTIFKPIQKLAFVN